MATEQTVTSTEQGRPFRVGIVAGEKSGDYLGAELIRAIRARRPDAQFVGLCGPLMIAEGATSLAEMDKISIFGLEGLIGGLREILAIRRTLLKFFKRNPPDVFIGVDVPDFNLTLERKLKECGVPTVHYVSPTVWAWRSGRINKIRNAVDMMLTLFPFERDFYQKKAVPVAYVGHPLATEALNWPTMNEFRSELLGDGETLIALLPGSRMSEVARLAPQMLSAALSLSAERPQIRFVIPAATEKIHDWLAERLTPNQASIALLSGRSRELLSVCDMAALASGTAALEAALFGKPMVVMYKVAWISAAAFSHTIEVEHFSMPNHLTATPLVPELIQARATTEGLLIELKKLLDDRAHFEQMQTALEAVAPLLAEDSGALAADAIFNLLTYKSTGSPANADCRG